MSIPRAIVTGATGFIGRNLVAGLAAGGWEVLCAVRKPAQPILEGVKAQVVDWAQDDSLQRFFSAAGPAKAFFHLGAALPTHQGGTLTEADYNRVNAEGTASLLKEALRAGIKNFVHASSISVIGKPVQIPVREDHPAEPASAYSLSKLSAERSCETARSQNPSARIVLLRITSPYGPGMPTSSVLPGFVMKALAGEELHWMGQGARTQNFIHVRDLVQLFLKAASAPEGGIFNAGGAGSIGMRDLAELIVRLVPGSKASASGQHRPVPSMDRSV